MLCGGNAAPNPRPQRAAARTHPRECVNLVANQPGQGPTEYRQARPIASRVTPLLGRHTDERAWRIGADAETAAQPRALAEPALLQRKSTIGVCHLPHDLPLWWACGTRLGPTGGVQNVDVAVRAVSDSVRQAEAMPSPRIDVQLYGNAGVEQCPRVREGVREPRRSSAG